MAAQNEQSAQITAFLLSVLDLPAEDSHLVVPLVAQAEIEDVRQGDYVFFEGDQSDTGYYVFEGRVTLRKTSPSGKDLIVGLLPVGEPFGLLAALEKRPFPLSAQAQCASRILSFPASVFSGLLETNPAVAKRLMEVIGERLRASHELSRALAHDRVEIRVAATLLSLRPRCAGIDPNEILLSRQDLADAAGITIETATRTMKHFEQDGIVDLSKFGRVRLLQPERLAHIIDDTSPK